VLVRAAMAATVIREINVSNCPGLRVELPCLRIRAAPALLRLELCIGGVALRNRITVAVSWHQSIGERACQCSPCGK
jgi:hypothetical protein